MKLLAIGQQPETVYLYKSLSETTDLDIIFHLNGNTIDIDGATARSYEGYECVLLEEQPTFHETLCLAEAIRSLHKGIPIILLRSYRKDLITRHDKIPFQCTIEKTQDGEYHLHCGLHHLQPGLQHELPYHNPLLDQPVILQYIAPCKARRRA